MNFLGAMYSAVLFLGATNATAVQSIVSIERTVFYREKAAGMYSPLPYAFAQVMNINDLQFYLFILLTEKIKCYSKFRVHGFIFDQWLVFISTHIYWYTKRNYDNKLAGGSRDDLHCYSNTCLLYYPLCYDWI